MVSVSTTHGFDRYVGDPWNIFDHAMFVILLLAFILRFALGDSDFTAARYVYAINVIMFYLRILQFYSIHRRLGPEVIVFWRMVGLSVIINHGRRLDKQLHVNIIIIIIIRFVKCQNGKRLPWR